MPASRMSRRMRGGGATTLPRMTKGATNFFLFLFPGREKAHAQHGAPAQGEEDNSPSSFYPSYNRITTLSLTTLGF